MRIHFVLLLCILTLSLALKKRLRMNGKDGKGKAKTSSKDPPQPPNPPQQPQANPPRRKLSGSSKEAFKEFSRDAPQSPPMSYTREFPFPLSPKPESDPDFGSDFGSAAARREEEFVAGTRLVPMYAGSQGSHSPRLVRAPASPSSGEGFPPFPMGGEEPRHFDPPRGPDFAVYTRSFPAIMPQAHPLSDEATDKNEGRKFFVLHVGDSILDESDIVVFKFGYFEGNFNNGVERSMPREFKGNVVVDTYVKTPQAEDFAKIMYTNPRFSRKEEDRNRNWFVSSLKVVRHEIGTIIDNHAAYGLLNIFEWVESPFPVLCKLRIKKEGDK